MTHLWFYYADMASFDVAFVNCFIGYIGEIYIIDFCYGITVYERVDYHEI